MALFKRKRTKTQRGYSVYFYGKKVRGELKSALTLAQWIKAGKPKAGKISKVKKRVAPKAKPLKKKKKLYTTRATKKTAKGLKRAGISKKRIKQLRD